MEAGFRYERCVLVSLLPEGERTFTGKVIRQDGRMYDFDVVLDLPKESTWQDVTDKFEERWKRGMMKPWSAELLAYEEYLRIRSGEPDP
jgi:hypothetical protein